MKIKHEVVVQVEDAVKFKAVEKLKHAALTVLDMHNLELNSGLMIVISDDDALHELNRRFRSIDAPTDVLSFMNDNRGPYAAVPGDFPQQLGDIVISIDRARAQAEDVNAALEEEMQLLVVHGVLHLLGYDHEEDDDKERMWAAQQHILQSLNIDIPLPE